MAYELEEARKLVLKACKELVEHNLIARTWGNISARVSATQFVITPSGRDYDSLVPEDLVIVDLKGNYEGSVIPSSEKGVHAQCYRLRPEVNFVIHTHQTYASALSVLGFDIRLGKRVSASTKNLLGPGLVCAEYGRNASKKLADSVASCLENNPDCSHVLMRYHGALCLGKDYDEAFKIAYTLEALSKKVYEYYIKEPIAVSPREIKVVQKLSSSILDENGESTERVGEWILHVDTPYVHRISEMGTAMKAYLDDCAQIAGTTIKCAPADADKKTIAKLRGDNCAVFIEGDGAYCYGDSLDEVHAVGIVLEKACVAAFLAEIKGAEPLKFTDAFHDRKTYIKKYSKLRKA